MSPVPCAPGACHRCLKGQLTPLGHLWEVPVPELGSTILLLPGAGQLLHTLFSLLLLPRVMWVTSASLACQDPRYCAWGGFFSGSPVQTGGRDFAWRSHIAQEWGGGGTALPVPPRSVPQLKGAWSC